MLKCKTNGQSRVAAEGDRRGMGQGLGWVGGVLNFMVGVEAGKGGGARWRQKLGGS